MKNLKKTSLMIGLVASLAGCFFYRPHQHTLNKYYGVANAFIEKGLTEYYFCDICGVCFDLNKKEMKDSNGIRINKYRNQKGIANLLGRDISIKYSDSFKVTLEDLYSMLMEDVKKEMVSFDHIVNEYMTFEETFMDVLYDYYSMSLIADFYNKDEYYLLQQEIYLYFFTLSGKEGEFLKSVANSKYKDEFFYGMSDEEINQILENSDPSMSDKVIAAREKMNAAQNKFNAGGDTAECFMEYKVGAQEMAEIQGYSNFIDYSYDVVYHRDYTLDDAKTMKQYMKDYIYPVYQKMVSESKQALDSFSEKQKEEYAYLRYNFCYNMDLIENYIFNFIGGNLKSSYNHLLNSGNYFLSATKNPRTTAYVNGGANGFDQIMFFSGNYQNTYTFIHEFGHYNAGYNSTARCYDTLETQSQGNEALFYYYLLNVDKTLDKDVVKAFTYDRLDELLFAVFGTYAVSVVEDYVYSHDTFTTEDLSKVWDNYFREIDPNSRYIGIDISDYCGYFLFNSPLYAISYSTSALGALEIYAMANNDINEAKKCYDKITRVTEEEGFKKAYKICGLTSAFDKETYVNIYNAMK